MKKILCFGAGDFGEAYKNLIDFKKPMGLTDDTIIAFVDNDTRLWGRNLLGIPIISPKQIAEIEYDHIEIAVMNHLHQKQICLQLHSMGIPTEKFSFCQHVLIFMDAFRVRYLRDYASYAYSHNIAGQVAECGVYKGDFARHINRCFYDRRLYLFDTFEGFTDEDIKYERTLNNSGFLQGVYNEIGLLKDTSIKTVMDKMVFPENCVVKEGYFPDTAQDVTDKFCFVSLDMDLYQPMSAALHFFWNRMTQGGVILVHDYSNPQLPGVAQSIADFENTKGHFIPKTPIADDGMFGSIALIKV